MEDVDIPPQGMRNYSFCAKNILKHFRNTLKSLRTLALRSWSFPSFPLSFPFPTQLVIRRTINATSATCERATHDAVH